MSRLNVEPRTIFCHDNLEILQGINTACIDLIYLDPPFNKNKVFAAPIGSSAEGAEFSDIFREEDVKDEWVKSIDADDPVLHDYLMGVKNFSNQYNYCYLVYMAIRILECKRILKETGSIYLHCDSTMSHYLKIVLDCVFGEKNFVNEIVWRKYSGRKNNATRKFATQNDIILFYCKSERAKVFKPVFTAHSDKEIEKKYRYIDKDGERYRKAWGRRYQLTGEQRRIYQKDSKGRPVGNLWIEEDLQLNTSSAERTGYPTQKPLALLERIITASSDEGDIVLDPFCGCATTCIAAERLRRRWIGIDVSHKAYDLVRERIKKEVTLPLLDRAPNFSTTPPKPDKDQPRDGGYIYIFSNSAWEGRYKVGISKNPKARLAGYQTSDPERGYQSCYTRYSEYYKELEKYIHAKFNAKNEWITGAAINDLKKAIVKRESELLRNSG